MICTLIVYINLVCFHYSKAVTTIIVIDKTKKTHHYILVVVLNTCLFHVSHHFFLR